MSQQIDLSAQYVTLATAVNLSNERVLTGTANQVILTDNGAGSTMVLSLPQSIATTSSPSFAGLTVSSAGGSAMTFLVQNTTTNAAALMRLTTSGGPGGANDTGFIARDSLGTNLGLSAPFNIPAYVFADLQDRPFFFFTGVLSGKPVQFAIHPVGNIVIGAAALATNATDGFLYIASCAGAPTGAPTAFTGRVPMIYDTTNNHFYINSGGTWRKVALA